MFVLASSVVMDTTEHRCDVNSGCVVCGHWHVRSDDTDWVGGMDESWTFREDRCQGPSCLLVHFPCVVMCSSVLCFFSFVLIHVMGGVCGHWLIRSDDTD